MRPSKAEYYLKIALQVAQRGTCLRRKFGAIIVKDDQIISTGYVGAPRGAKNCCDIGECPRQTANIPPGERYELCRSVHAEANAIIGASRLDMIGSTLYLAGIQAERMIDSVPCRMCKRLIVNAGIKNVVGTLHETHPGDFDSYVVSVETFITDEILDLSNVRGY